MITPHQEITIISSINSLIQESHQIAEDHGFTRNTPGEDIALMHSELSEALEDIRAGKRLDELSYSAIDGKPCGVPSELADVVIRILHFCGRHEIDLGRAIIHKMAYNRKRPFKHGGKTL